MKCGVERLNKAVEEYSEAAEKYLEFMEIRSGRACALSGMLAEIDEADQDRVNTGSVPHVIDKARVWKGAL